MYFMLKYICPLSTVLLPIFVLCLLLSLCLKSNTYYLYVYTVVDETKQIDTADPS